MFFPSGTAEYTASFQVVAGPNRDRAICVDDIAHDVYGLIDQAMWRSRFKLKPKPFLHILCEPRIRHLQVASIRPGQDEVIHEPDLMVDELDSLSSSLLLVAIYLSNGKRHDVIA